MPPSYKTSFTRTYEIGSSMKNNFSDISDQIELDSRPCYQYSKKTNFLN
ncbi:protein of unknown function [Candidatus Nitrosocosmicus franklandus]|uniref:Uncharacterized protein n=1 Tax=Candidatus Nitrosocosmicus franklandianus TaxID=1798806 RepID=A0A484I792_9ARCH|nr:protein of unknown function [Candidatus Nitrosocosmicus franklandus]